MWTLAVEYPSAINNANIKGEIHRMHLTMELIAEARRMYEMYGLGCDSCADYKKIEVGAATSITNN